MFVREGKIHKPMGLFRVCKHIRHEGIVLPTSFFNFLILFGNNANKSDVTGKQGKHRYKLMKKAGL